MEIGPLSNRRAGSRTEGEANRKQEATPTSPGRTPQRTDRVDISLEARTRLAESADRELTREKTEPQPISSGERPRPERLEQIRERIASGYYNDPGVRSKIVDRMIDDLDG
jgi:anti-sigma28 factor (negative regulator of flagellin synthesis)